MWIFDDIPSFQNVGLKKCVENIQLSPQGILGLCLIEEVFKDLYSLVLPQSLHMYALCAKYAP